MPRCCGQAGCNCLIQAGERITVAGTGTAQDPFVIAGDVSLVVVDNSVFNLTLTGAGTAISPWTLSLAYASTAKLDDLPDVNAPTPTNGHVIGWDSATSKWTNRAPTTAASGSVLTDTSLDGDGSSGTPLTVVEDPFGFIETTANGIGISDDGKNSMVLRYATDSDRATSTLTPDINALSALDTAPGVTWYWDGSQWAIVANGFDTDFSGQLLAMSGPYSGGPVTLMVRQIVVTTNADGTFDALSTADLAGAAGVVTAVLTETGTVAYKALLNANLDSIQGTAYRLDDGTPYASQAITATVLGYIY